MQNSYSTFVLKNVNFFIVKVLVKSNKDGCEVILIYFYSYLILFLSIL
jgi:hypothetical protein